MQLSTLLSIKTGGCPEDCGYCPQAKRYHTAVEDEKLVESTRCSPRRARAKAQGATRFCMGAAWRGPKERDLVPVLEMVRGVKALGLETCCTLGMLKDGQAEALKGAGLDYYNHNLDTAPEFYGEVITTRDYDDRLDTLARVRDAGTFRMLRRDRRHGRDRGRSARVSSRAREPRSLSRVGADQPLVQVAGTPLHERFGGDAALDPLEFVRTVAVARITMPKAMVRLSAGRRELGDAVQALCFVAGANSIFYGDKLLTTGNPEIAADRALLASLGLHATDAPAA